ncbi:MAG: hypothetical protein GVY18_05890 [Bacteroidetes bacterium]|jgi:uncharacterized surface protein with fasciclin (FAS1) repeats|nr:hypothetical protein [Bacteroidota bacterium]
MTLSFAEDDLNLMVDGATILNPDVQAANGVIHVIDGVLTPTPGDTPQ